MVCSHLTLPEHLLNQFYDIKSLFSLFSSAHFAWCLLADSILYSI
jgi:hypothetical protein